MLGLSDLDREDRRRLIGGVQPVVDREIGIPSSYLDDLHNCPYSLDGSCEGVKDPEYKTRCVGGDFSYSRCGIFKSRLENPNPYDDAIPISDALTDTVIMNVRDVVNSRKGDDYSSVQDRIDDGKNVRELASFRRNVKISSVDDRADI